MAKLVVLSAGMTGRTHELKADKTTIGRVEDNTFQIAEASVSSHHAEVLLRGNDVVIKDLNSTNGTFINGEKVETESVLKPGQTLRLGQIELRLEVEGMPAPPPSSAPVGNISPVPPRKQLDQTVVMQRGVSLDQLQSGTGAGFDTSKVFSKKSNKTNKWFLIGGIAAVIVLIIVFIIVFKSI